MNAILLVAIREFRQMAKTRAFRLMLVGFPLMIGLAILGTRYFAGPGGSAYMIDDASGHYASVIEARIDQDTASPGNPASFLRAPLPAQVAGAKGAEAFGQSVSPLLQGNVPTSSGPKPLAIAAYIPADFGAPGVAARVWTSGAQNPQLLAALRATLTQGLQRGALLRRGLDPQEAVRIQALRAPVIVTEPRAGTRPAVVIRSAAPFALVYLLVMAVIISGSMMLQGVIEERSNKLLEAILACIRPGDLMKGKLFGLAAIGLLLISVWVGILLFVGNTVHGPVADFLKPLLTGLTQPWMIAALLFYFLTGYLVVSLLFLGIGSVSNSMQDAQGYLMPLIWALMIPIVLMVTSAVRNPGGLFPRIMSWIPVYTPFAMLARLGGGVALWEVIGTGVLLLAFLALEFVLIGRVFEANLLAAGQPPKWSALKKIMSGK